VKPKPTLMQCSSRFRSVLGPFLFIMYTTPLSSLIASLSLSPLYWWY